MTAPLPAPPPSCVLITGGTGSFGRTMLRALLAETAGGGVGELRVLSRDEEKQDALRRALGDPRVRFYIGDVRDRASVERAALGADCIFHAAALKQVPSCEFFPLEAVRTNVLGSENVVRAGIAAGARAICFLSTDKAVFPINAMGMTKALMEKVALAAARELGPGAATTVSVVRYGNVMYSRGSVIPLFVEQIRSGRPITLTEPAMTRFLMALGEAAGLVRHALAHAAQGDLFVRRAPAARMADLAAALVRLFGVPDHAIEVIGWRHGEKLHETLASARELARAEAAGDFLRIPMDGRDLNYAAYFSEGDVALGGREDYDSGNAERLDVDGIVALLGTLPEIRAELAAWRAAGGGQAGGPEEGRA